MSIRTARYQEEALAKALGFKRPPVNVEQIAKHLGLKVVRVDLGDDISGLLISKGDSTTIAVQESDPPKRQRFTIAHEIAHFHLRHSLNRASMSTSTEVILLRRAIPAQVPALMPKRSKPTSLPPAY
jgi:Zn-dependent peptidase ImmA (M78 family)